MGVCGNPRGNAQDGDAGSEAGGAGGDPTGAAPAVSLGGPVFTLLAGRVGPSAPCRAVDMTGPAGPACEARVKVSVTGRGRWPRGSRGTGWRGSQVGSAEPGPTGWGGVMPGFPLWRNVCKKEEWVMVGRSLVLAGWVWAPVGCLSGDTPPVHVLPASGLTQRCQKRGRAGGTTGL